MAKKWPGMVVKRSFIKELLFVNRLYYEPPAFSDLVTGLRIREPLEFSKDMTTNYQHRKQILEIFKSNNDLYI